MPVNRKVAVPGGRFKCMYRTGDDRCTRSNWRNDLENGPRYSVTVSRLYKDGEEWKTTDSVGRDDLPLAGKALDMAHTWILEQPDP